MLLWPFLHVLVMCVCISAGVILIIRVKLLLSSDNEILPGFFKLDVSSVYTFHGSESWSITVMVHSSCLLFRKVSDCCPSTWCPRARCPSAHLRTLVLLLFLLSGGPAFFSAIVWSFSLQELGLVSERWEGCVCLPGMVRMVLWGQDSRCFWGLVCIRNEELGACCLDMQYGICGVMKTSVII